MRPLITTWLELDALIFKTGAKGSIEVEWADVSQPDPEVLARTAETLNRAVAVSTETKVKMIHPDWDEEAIADEVALVQAESGAMVPEPTPFPDGTEPPADEPTGV